MKELIKNNLISAGILIFLILLLIFFFDSGLAMGFFILMPAVFLTLFFLDKTLIVGLSFLFFLSAITLFIFYKLGLKDKTLYSLFLIALLVHLGAVLFFYYTSFQPFSGGQGDYTLYHETAVKISQSFRQGIFSLKDISFNYPDLYVAHYYPVVVGFVYTLTLPEMLIGQMFNAWLAAISVIFVYFIIQEIGGTKKDAFLVGLIAAIYPSYVFYTSLLLKDALVIFFTILGLWLAIKLIKRFSWPIFLAFYAALIGSIHFRFYIGYALLVAFIFSWFLLAKLKLKKKFIYGLIILFILGFAPQIASNQGYYGIKFLTDFINPEMINFYRESAYSPVPKQEFTIGRDSTIPVEKNILGYLKSFTYIVLGPFPWQMKYFRHLFALFEIIPWYFLLFFIVRGILKLFKNHIKESFPLIIFSLMVFMVLAVFINNFGIITRIRVPAFISLLCLLPFGLNGFKNINLKLNEKFYFQNRS